MPVYVVIARDYESCQIVAAGINKLFLLPLAQGALAQLVAEYAFIADYTVPNGLVYVSILTFEDNIQVHWEEIS